MAETNFYKEGPKLHMLFNYSQKNRKVNYDKSFSDDPKGYMELKLGYLILFVILGVIFYTWINYFFPAAIIVLIAWIAYRWKSLFKYKVSEKARGYYLISEETVKNKLKSKEYFLENFIKDFIIAIDNNDDVLNYKLIFKEVPSDLFPYFYKEILIPKYNQIATNILTKKDETLKEELSGFSELLYNVYRKRIDEVIGSQLLKSSQLSESYKNPPLDNEEDNNSS
jgi:hypothetical protein